ncbi:MAG: Fe-S cluster assembly protein SufD [Chloroherpetonaceae bacterium]
MKLNEIQENLNFLYKDGNSNERNILESVDFLKNNKVPNSKIELWKYTSLSSLQGIDFSLEAKEELNQLPITKILQGKDIPLNSIVIPIANGKLMNNSFEADDRFSIEIREIEKLNEYAKNYHPLQSVEFDYFYHLNTVLAQKEIHLQIHKNSDPIQIVLLFISQSDRNSFISPRVRIELEENSNAKIAYKFINLSESEILSNLFSEIVLKQNAILDFYVIEDGLENFQAINNINIVQERDSKLTSNSFTNNTKFIRNFLRLYFTDENCEAILNGLFIGNNKDLIDNHILIEHIKPNCHSNQLYKGILNDSSIGIFNGAILVHPNAQKTNAFQTNRNILTSDLAKIYTKPELEIYADDVKCSHGEATGFIDDDMLFYLRSRGISEENAKKLLLQAFAVDVLNKFQWVEIKEPIESHISANLEV